jgi:hypothetical protein
MRYQSQVITPDYISTAKVVYNAIRRNCQLFRRARDLSGDSSAASPSLIDSVDEFRYLANLRLFPLERKLQGSLIDDRGALPAATHIDNPGIGKVRIRPNRARLEPDSPGILGLLPKREFRIGQGKMRFLNSAFEIDSSSRALDVGELWT